MDNTVDSLSQSRNFKLINERYPHLGQKISAQWGSPSFNRFIEDLIRQSFGGSRQGFSEQVEEALKALSAEHKQAHEAAVAMDSKSSLENSSAFRRLNSHYERLAKIIADLWGSDVLTPYISKLLNDSKDGKRQGFPAEIAEALISLMTEHERRFPHTQEKSGDVWGSNELR